MASTAAPGMLRWRGRVALVTGASKGIGACIATTLARHGMKVVGCARNPAPMQALVEELSSDSESGSLTALQCDMTQPAEIEAMFATIERDLGGVDVCVNNAGIWAGPGCSLLAGDVAAWQETLNTNLLAAAQCSQLAVRSMRARGLPDGQLVNICSLAGHGVNSYASLHVYNCSKYGVTALTEGLRQELLAVNAAAGSRLRVGQISPGLVYTPALGAGPPAEDGLWPPAGLQGMKPQDVADAVVYLMSAPPNVQVDDIILRPISQID